MSVTERLHFLMQKHGLSLPALAALTGISDTNLYLILYFHAEPCAHVIAQLAIALHTSADFIVGLTDDPAQSKNGRPMVAPTE